VKTVNSLHLRALFLGYRHAVVGRDALDHKHPITLEDLSDGLNVEALAVNFDLTRLQRACERAGQSTACSSDDVVEGCRVRWEVFGSNAVVLCHLRVNAKRYRLILGGKISEPLRSSQPLDAHSRYVCRLSHAKPHKPWTFEER
jgi:hypothetical protein